MTGDENFSTHTITSIPHAHGVDFRISGAGCRVESANRYRNIWHVTAQTHWVFDRLQRELTKAEPKA